MMMMMVNCLQSCLCVRLMLCLNLRGEDEEEREKERAMAYLYSTLATWGNALLARFALGKNSSNHIPWDRLHLQVSC